MLETIELILSILYYLLLIFLIVIIILQVLYPEFAFRDFFGFKDDNHHKEDAGGTNEHDDVKVDIDDSPESLESKHQMVEYTKYKQNFNIKEVDPTQVIKEDQMTYKDFIKLIADKSFLEDYLDSVQTIIEVKIKIYSKWRTRVQNDLRSYKSKSNTPGTHDSNVDLLNHTERELTEILDIAHDTLKKLTVLELKKNFKQMIYNKKYGFVSIIGRDDVKDFLIRKIYAFSRNPNVFLYNFQNMRFYGIPGIGKSKLAECVGYIYSKSYILIRCKYREYTAKDFTSQYVKESPRLTYKLLLSALEGLAFVDEAPGLKVKKLSIGSDPNDEVLTEYVKFLEKPEERCMVVILAGYEDEMNELMQSNEGLIGRFPYCFTLSNYNSQQLTDILIKFMNVSDPTLELDIRDTNCLYTYIDYLNENTPKVFEQQARSMKNLSGNILEVILNSRSYDFTPGDSKDAIKQRIYLIHHGFNSYLAPFGISIKT
jgi:hypothetical protein